MPETLVFRFANRPSELVANGTVPRVGETLTRAGRTWEVENVKRSRLGATIVEFVDPSQTGHARRPD